MSDLTGKIAVITGSARKTGLGFAIAERFVAEGASVVLSDVAPMETQLNESVAALREKGGKVIPVLCDVTSEQDVAGLIETTVKELGGLHILVNNAGILRDTLMMRMTLEDWDKVLDINLRGAFLCTKAALRPMIKQRWGRIINVSSAAGVMGNVGQANYSSAKAGLIGLTKTTARELASRNITANAVAPGIITTDIIESMTQQAKDFILAQIPLGRYGKPEDVAEVVGFLASDRASYLTGQVIHVDGGMIMY